MSVGGRDVWVATEEQIDAVEQLAWLAAAAVVGFMVAFVGASVLALPRDLFVLVHLIVSGAFVGAFACRLAQGARPQRQSGTRTGLAVGLGVAGLMAGFVLAGPADAGVSGLTLVWSVIWLGLAYGVVDAMLLTVLPVDAVGRITRNLRWPRGLAGGAATGALCILASAIVTTGYHLGFPEFRGGAIVQPLIGNTIISLAYCLSGSRLTPVVAHVALHVAAVIHAYHTSIPLPPHY